MADLAHPFRSPDAKQEYLARYDEHAERWPIASESKLVNTAFGQTFVRIPGPAAAPALVLLPGDTENSLAWIRTDSNGPTATAGAVGTSDDLLLHPTPVHRQAVPLLVRARRRRQPWLSSTRTCLAALVTTSDESFMVDAAAEAANFEMMTRLADGTGAKLPEVVLERQASTIGAMGVANLTSRR